MILGTEDPDLLKREYEMLKLAIEKPREAPDRRFSRELMIERDKFIARRIDKTLHGGSVECFSSGPRVEVRITPPATKGLGGFESNPKSYESRALAHPTKLYPPGFSAGLGGFSSGAAHYIPYSPT